MNKTFAQKHWPNEDKYAVAYLLYFLSVGNSYDDSIHDDFFKPCHKECHPVSVHYKDFTCPRSGIKKDYFQLDWGYFGISTMLKERITSFGIDDDPEQIFRPIWTKKHDEPIAWSIEPSHILPELLISDDYDYRTVCPVCGLTHAVKKDFVFKNGICNAVYITEKSFVSLHDFNYTKESYGPGGYLARDVIISKRIADHILSIFPRAELCPVLIGKK